MKSLKIVIDPGHGGSNRVGGSNSNNATGPNGTLEKELTLQVSLLVAGLLANLGQTIRLTRAQDVNLSLAARAAVAKKIQADVFLSIHFNGFHEATVQGTETLVSPRASNASRKLAAAVQRRIVEALGHRDRGVKEQELGVLRPERHASHTAACLVEPCFLTDADEEARLEDEDYQLKLATAIADGILDDVTTP